MITLEEVAVVAVIMEVLHRHFQKPKSTQRANIIFWSHTAVLLTLVKDISVVRHMLLVAEQGTGWRKLLQSLVLQIVFHVMKIKHAIHARIIWFYIRTNVMRVVQKDHILTANHKEFQVHMRMEENAHLVSKHV